MQLICSKEKGLAMEKGEESKVWGFDRFSLYSQAAFNSLRSSLVCSASSRRRLRVEFISSYQDTLIFNLKTSPPLARLRAQVGAIGLAAKL